METGAQHRIAYDYRDHEGDWERIAVATLSTPEVIDLLMWLAINDPAARTALSKMEQEATLQDMTYLDLGPLFPAVVAN